MKFSIQFILDRWRIPNVQYHRIHSHSYSHMIKEIFIQHDHHISSHFSKNISFSIHYLIADTSIAIKSLPPDVVPIAMVHPSIFTIPRNNYYIQTPHQSPLTGSNMY